MYVYSMDISYVLYLISYHMFCANKVNADYGLITQKFQRCIQTTGCPKKVDYLVNVPALFGDLKQHK